MVGDDEHPAIGMGGGSKHGKRAGNDGNGQTHGAPDSGFMNRYRE